MQLLISQLLAFQPHSSADPQPIRDDKGMVQPLCNPTLKGSLKGETLKGTLKVPSPKWIARITRRRGRSRG